MSMNERPLLRCPFCMNDFRPSRDDLELSKCTHCGEVCRFSDAVMEALRDRELYASDYRREAVRRDDVVTFSAIHDFLHVGSVELAVAGYVASEKVLLRDRDGTVQRDADGKPKFKIGDVWHIQVAEHDGHIRKLTENDKLIGRKLSPKYAGVDAPLHTYTGRMMEVDIVETFREVLDRLASITFATPSDAATVACYCIASHFYPIFSSFPNLVIGKPGFDSGGSALLIAAGCLLPRPVYVVDASEAVIYRLIEESRCSLLIDEFRSDLDRKKKDAILLLLDSSFTKGAQIPRASGKGFAPELFSVYGPKMLVDPDTVVSRSSSISRDIYIGLQNDPGRSVISDPKYYVEKNRFLINKLYALYLRYAYDVAAAYKRVENEGIFHGRALQAFAPLLAVADLIGIRADILPTLYANLDLTSAMKNVGDPTRALLHEIGDYLAEILPRICENQRPDAGWHYTAVCGFFVRIKTIQQHLIQRFEEEYQRDATNGGITERIWSRLPSGVGEILKGASLVARMKALLPDNIGAVNKRDRHVFLHFKDARELIMLIRKIGTVIGVDYQDLSCDDADVAAAPTTNNGTNCGSEGEGNSKPTDPQESTQVPQCGSDGQRITRSTDPQKGKSTEDKQIDGERQQQSVFIPQKCGSVDQFINSTNKSDDPHSFSAVDQTVVGSGNSANTVTDIFAFVLKTVRDKCLSVREMNNLIRLLNAEFNTGMDRARALVEAWIVEGFLQDENGYLSPGPKAGGN